MKRTGFAVACACAMVAIPPGAAAAELPTPLELRYVLRYGGIEVGHVTKTLTRGENGVYDHRSRSVPKGPLRMFTTVEWFEEGRFEVVNGHVRPLRFLEYRVGADKPHRHEATFDWKKRIIHYAGWPDVKLRDGTQDQGSIVYAWILEPPPRDHAARLFVSTGKKLREYRYREAGHEVIDTLFGRIQTRVIERRPLADDREQEIFRVWLAPAAHNLPVRISTEKRGQDTVLDLESVRGAWAPDSSRSRPQ